MGLRLYCNVVGSLALMLSSISTLIFWAQPEIFAGYEAQAEQKLAKMSLEEKIGQVLLVRYPDFNGAAELERYQFGGYVFFAKDFANKTTTEVQSEMQNHAKIPILTAVDEEGGVVVRVSSNRNLAKTKFASPQELYNNGGLEAVKADTLAKSEVLQNLGINLNLAPVVDVSTNSNDYMYSRSLGQDAWQTAQYAQTVITASKREDVSYTLKHFPGYGNNVDTHKGMSVDTRDYEEILQNDLLPFRTGIEAGAEAVLVSHNIVSSVDAENPASLSLPVHKILRKQLNFGGVIITDDIAMEAVAEIPDTSVRALRAGNDLIITTDYVRSINEIKQALASGALEEEVLNCAAKRVIAWKYYKGMIEDW